MSSGHADRWSPLSITAVAELFDGVAFRWFIAGGHALELAVGRSWRHHDDMDVGVCRRDLDAIHDHLAHWDLRVAAGGDLTPWDGRPLQPDRHENNIWARPTEGGPWAVDIVVGGGDEDGWQSRRDPTIRLPWDQALHHDESGVPYLAPHVQLLMKSRHVRPKDDVDAGSVIPTLTAPQRKWLIEHLPREHHWRRIAGNGTAMGEASSNK